MSEPKKNLYCEVCKTFPEEIETQVAQVTKRKWNGVLYEAFATDILEDTEIHTCGVCGTILEERVC